MSAGSAGSAVSAPAAPEKENVWDYPRPPSLKRAPWPLTVEFGGAVIASAKAGEAWAVRETSHPPTYYLPRAAFAEGALRPARGARGSVCEWKGRATYWDLVSADGSKVVNAGAWSYEDPTASFAPIKGHVALYASNVDKCTVNGEAVTPQPGDFYGGWATSWISGGERGFKGPPGTMFW